MAVTNSLMVSVCALIFSDAFYLTPITVNRTNETFTFQLRFDLLHRFSMALLQAAGERQAPGTLRKSLDIFTAGLRA